LPCKDGVLPFLFFKKTKGRQTLSWNARLATCSRTARGNSSGTFSRDKTLQTAGFYLYVDI